MDHERVSAPSGSVRQCSKAWPMYATVAAIPEYAVGRRSLARGAPTERSRYKDNPDVKARAGAAAKVSR